MTGKKNQISLLPFIASQSYLDKFMIYPFLYDRHNEHRETLFLKAVGSFKGYEIICRGPLIEDM